VTSGGSNDQPPNLLGLNDFPRLVTQDNKSVKSPSDSLINSLSTTTTQGPSFRPANLASWKEGGGRAQPISNDITSKDSNENLSSLAMQSQMLPPNSNLLQQQQQQQQQQMQNPNNSSYMRMYQQQPQQMVKRIFSLVEKYSESSSQFRSETLEGYIELFCVYF
jgi:hypothetical protein